MKILFTSLRALLILTLVTGVIYPLAITSIASQFFPIQANGTLIVENGVTRGSLLVAQKFEADGFFHSRPSAVDYATVASGASNQGFTSAKLLQVVRERQALVGSDAPSDLLYASASGLDPHISPDAAHYQAARVAAARNVPTERITNLVNSHIEMRQFGFLGEARVNVLKLNLAVSSLQ